MRREAMTKYFYVIKICWESEKCIGGLKGDGKL